MVAKVCCMSTVRAMVLMRRMLVVLMLVVLVLLELGQVHLHRKALVRVAVQHAVLALLRVRLVIHAEWVVRGRLRPRRA